MAALSRSARAQAYPSRPVRLVVGFPAGGTNDIHARLIAEWLSKQFDRSFIVENRPGAGGNIGLDSVVRAAPDGYTLSVCGSTELRNEILYNDLKFSFMHDTAPVASIMLAMNVLVVHPASSVHSVPELIAAANRAGIRNHSCFMNGRTVVAYLEGDNIEKSSAQLANDPVKIRWNEYMEEFLEPGAIPLEEVFHME